LLDCLGRAIDFAEAGLASVLCMVETLSIASRKPVNDRQRLVLSRMLNGF